MINNKNIFSCEELDYERSQEGGIIEKLKIAFGIIAIAYFLLVAVFIPIYKHTPLYKYLLKRKKDKEKELAKQREKEHEEQRKAEDRAFEQIENHPEIKRLQDKLTELENVAAKFSKGIVSVLRKEISKIDPKHHIDVYVYDGDVELCTDLSSVLWDRCVEIAKAIKDKKSVNIRVDRPVFCIDG